MNGSRAVLDRHNQNVVLSMLLPGHLVIGLTERRYDMSGWTANGDPFAITAQTQVGQNVYTALWVGYAEPF